VKNRWRNIRDRYIKEKKKFVTKSGQAAVQLSPWSLMESLSFLSDIVEPRSQLCSTTQLLTIPSTVKSDATIGRRNILHLADITPNVFSITRLAVLKR